ncbi:HAD family hydrolase [Brachyspira sp.]|uniref:HAD family hydrolase n=1 Tax=Brachyspira sp. TaxID=1977261 RepID=UPI002608B4DB|nr:HAD hydrolase family protein [Brachyspira sp.]
MSSIVFYFIIYKCIIQKIKITDLDGTLLNSKKEITDYSKEILLELIHNMNIEFVISTVCLFESIVHYNELLNNNNYSIVFNGVSIYDSKANIIYYNRTIELL